MSNFNRLNCRSNLCGIILGLIFIAVVYHMLQPGKLPAFKKRINSFNPSRCSSFDIDFVEENILELDQKDPQLIQYVRARHLTPPSKLPYKLKSNTTKPDAFSKYVANFFQNKRDGIFIEAGAHEGEDGSHTLYLETELGWTGLLIECNPTVVPILRNHHRKAWVAGTCIAPTPTPSILNFSNPTNWTYSGTFKEPWKLPKSTEWVFYDVETVPLYTLLAAIDMYEVDYFSFDIEGVELSVLENFPFDLVTFKLFIIEIQFYKKNEVKRLNDLLAINGYEFIKKIQHDNIYVHESAKHLIPD